MSVLTPDKMKRRYFFLLLSAVFLTSFSSFTKAPLNYKALIVTGQNNHNWKVSHVALKKMLDQTGLFTTDIAITPPKGGDMSTFDPDFSKYKVVVLDYNGESWSEKTKAAFLNYVQSGGGVVSVHAADNSFPEWKEYNEIIGLGGWGDRSEKDGPYVYYQNDKVVVDNTTPGVGGSHMSRHEFEVRIRNMNHPITKGLPERWMHGSDELYSQLRGPGKNMEILATAFADPKGKGTGRDEPMLMTIRYGKGRIFHTVLGHPGTETNNPAMDCVGFIVTFQRGTEWAASGAVTQAVPYDFPTSTVMHRPGPDYKQLTLEEDMAGIAGTDVAKSAKYYSDLQARMKYSSSKGEKLLPYEKLMVNVLKNDSAPVESKRMMLHELSWMGSKYSVPAIKALAATPELKNDAESALTKLKSAK
jgi:type 1 glutamine amidotransferase